MEYVWDKLTVFHSLFLSACEKRQSTKSVSIGHYVMPPVPVQDGEDSHWIDVSVCSFKSQDKEITNNQTTSKPLKTATTAVNWLSYLMPTHPQKKTIVPLWCWPPLIKSPTPFVEETQFYPLNGIINNWNIRFFD